MNEQPGEHAQLVLARLVQSRLEGARLDGRSADWWNEMRAKLRDSGDGEALARILSLASRFVGRGALAPDAAERAAAGDALEGWNPERWTLLEAARVGLVLAYAETHANDLFEALEGCFRYADEGELCALYRSLQFLPDGARFAWRGGEGCRSNMGTVFQADACDTGFPFRHFEPLAWRQMCIKALFTGAPLWRVYGLDRRLDAELTRMALDLAEERRSAGRPISPDLWLCLGPGEPERAQRALEAELAGASGPGRVAAVLALGRTGRQDLLEQFAAHGGADVAQAARRALAGDSGQGAWRSLLEDTTR